MDKVKKWGVALCKLLTFVAIFNGLQYLAMGGLLTIGKVYGWTPTGVVMAIFNAGALTVLAAGYMARLVFRLMGYMGEMARAGVVERDYGGRVMVISTPRQAGTDWIEQRMAGRSGNEQPIDWASINWRNKDLDAQCNGHHCGQAVCNGGGGKCGKGQ